MRVFILATIWVVAKAAAVAPPQLHGIDVSSASNATKYAQESGQPLSSPASAESQAAAASAQKTEEVKHENSLRKRLIDPLIANWPLLVLGVGTLVVVGIQAREMRNATQEMRGSTKEVRRQADILERQTKATEKSVNLQEVAMRQWVSIENWDGEFVSREGQRTVEFRFDVVNRTKFPFKVEYVMTNAYGCGTQQKVNRVLGPETVFGVKRNTGPLSDKQYLNYRESRLTISITGAVTYEDVFEKRRTQWFNANCYCSARSGFFFYPYAGTQENTSGEEKSENQPN